MEYDREIRANAFGLELTAMSPVWNADDPPSEAEIELSKAVSAKRIADALEKSAEPQELVAMVEDLQREEVRFVSLAQRIGDAVAEALAQRLVKVFHEPLNQYGESIGECIQGQMLRGQRGVEP